MKAKTSTTVASKVREKEYDLVFIIKPNLADEEYSKLVDKVKEWLTKNQGEITLSNVMGSRELAQPLDRFSKGYYVHFQFMGTAKTVEVLKQNIKVTEVIFRHLLVTMDSLKSTRKSAEAEA